MTTQLKADRVLDVKGTFCPVPVIEAKLAIDAMQPGQVLEVLATDAGSQRDFPAWCKNTCHILLEAQEQDGVFRYLIKKAG